MDGVVLNNVFVNEGLVEYRFSVSGSLKQYFTTDVMYIQYNESVEDIPESILTVPFVASILPLMWVTNTVMWVKELDRTFYDSIHKIRDAYQRLYSHYQLHGNLVAANLLDNVLTIEKDALLLFSGGLDANSTYVRHHSKHPLLFNIQGWYKNLTDVDNAAEADIKNIASFAKAENLDFTYAKSIVAISAGFASGIFLYLYAKKRYGTKLITGIILIVGSNTISSVFGFIFNKVASNIEFNNPAQYSYLMTSVSKLIVLAFSTVWFIIFFKNRRKENELKLLWLKRVLAITSAAFALVMNIYFFFALNGNPSHAEIYENQNAYDIILMIGSLVVCVLGLLMDIYIVVKGRKASKDNELEIVGE